MSKLIIHAGLAKTGTTSLQSFLFEHTVFLRAEKVLYSKRFLHDGHAHHKVAMWIKNGELNTVRREMEMLKLDSDGFDSTVISSEEICTLNKEQIEQFLSIVTPIFRTVDVVFTIRPHFSLFSGSYKQQIREAYLSLSISEFWLLARKHAKFLNLRSLDQLWRGVGAKFRVNINYLCTEHGLVEKDIVSQFLGSILKINQRITFSGSTGKQNISLSSSQMKAINQITQVYGKVWESSVTWDHRRFVYYTFQNIDENFKKLSKKEDSEFIATELLILENCVSYFEEDWAYLVSITEKSLPEFSMVENWYNQKHRKISDKLDSLDDIASDIAFNLEHWIAILEDLYGYYERTSSLITLGPSEQLLIYKKDNGLI